MKTVRDHHQFFKWERKTIVVKLFWRNLNYGITVLQ
jgi:hypothetical protein